MVTRLHPSFLRSSFAAMRLMGVCLGGVMGIALVGCGDSSSTSSITRGPVVSTTAPVGVAATSEGVVVGTATAPRAGNDVTIRVEIASTTALDVINNPPRIDVFGPSGQTLISGPQPLTSLNSDPNGYAYIYNIPANTPKQQYTFVIYAQDTFGNKGNTPYTLGVFSLP